MKVVDRAAFAAAVLTLPLACGPSGSATETHASGSSGVVRHDTRHDVVGDVVYTVGVDYENPHHAPTTQIADIRRFDSTYAGSHLRMTVKVGRLTPDAFGLSSRIAVPGPDAYLLEVEASGTGPVDVILTRFHSKKNLYPHCAGIVVRRRSATNSVSLSVPSTCLHDPRWVRTGLTYGVYLASAQRHYSDDARADGYNGHVSPRLGPRLYRG